MKSTDHKILRSIIELKSNLRHFLSRYTVSCEEPKVYSAEVMFRGNMIVNRYVLGVERGLRDGLKLYS